MYKLLRMGALITFAMLVGCMAGCGSSDEDQPEKVDEPVKINLIATSPENGGKIPVDGDLRIVFDNSPKSVTVDGKPTIILNNTVIVKITDLPNVIPGAEKTIAIEWRNPDNSVAGAKTLTFTVLKPVEDPPQSDDDDVGVPDAATDNDDIVADSLDDVGPPSATTVTVGPAPGATVLSNQQFWLIFDQGVTAATVNGTVAFGSDRLYLWVASPALAEGAATLNVRWTNRDGSTGSKAVGPYIVSDLDTTAPTIARGTVADGDVDVDPAAINFNGFRFDFDEAVRGTIKLTDEAGNDFNWVAYVDAQTATLVPVAGQELSNESIYRVEIDVADVAGNKTEVTITFITRIKE